MKFEITLTPKEKDNDELILTLDTNEGQFKIKSYGTTMNYESFCEFADAIQEIRQKFTNIKQPGSNDNV